MINVYATYNNIVSSLGFTTEENVENILDGKSGIILHKETHFSNQPFYASIIEDKKLNKAFSEINTTSEKYTKLEKMMILSLHQTIQASEENIDDKTGIIISSTKGNIDALDIENPFSEEKAYLTSLGKTIQDFFSFNHKPIIISNACVSGVLAIAVAKRFLQINKYDKIFVVSGDVLTKFVLSGFNSFKAISEKPCKPFDKDRTGITLGEAACSMLITTKESKESVAIIGEASSNDANHISGPSRTGEGLYRSIIKAKKEAEANYETIDYISAHGTATLFNDEMESIAFHRAGLSNVPVNSYKGYYGHTLGSSGLLESILGIESMKRNTLFPSIGFETSGTSHLLNVIKENTTKNISAFIKTASGFGGCNTAVIFKKQ